MFDEKSTRELIGRADPVRGVAVPPPRSTPVALILAADRSSAEPTRSPLGARRLLGGRRLALTAAAAVLVAGAPAAFHTFATPTPPSTPAASGGVGEVRLGPVIVPVAVQYEQAPPAAGDQLRALADKVGPAPYDHASGRYTYIHTAGWNAVQDGEPGGHAQVIHPSDRQIWYLVDGSGRVKTTRRPDVYPNEESRRYWQKHSTADPTPTRTPANPVADLPAGQVGPRQPLPSDPAQLAVWLGADQIAEHGVRAVLRSVCEVYYIHLVPRRTRAEILRILADLEGISWRGAVTDRAGRAGVAISVDSASEQRLLIFAPDTGGLLACDEVQKPTDTVAGATLFLGYDRTDKLD